MQIAVEGCCHGDLDKIYATLQAMEVAENRTIDLLICCGDFQVFVLTLRQYQPLPGKRRQFTIPHSLSHTTSDAEGTRPPRDPARQNELLGRLPNAFRRV